MSTELLDFRPAAPPRVVRVALQATAAAPEGPLAPCPRCGSKGVNVHQRDWRTVKDPHAARVLVLRYLCKRCGHVRRAYPAGLGPSRQSAALRQLSVLLYWIGLSYQAVRAVLLDLGCPLSTTSIRRNVVAAQQRLHGQPPLSRLRLAPAGAGVLAGPDGRLVVRLVGHPASGRYLEVEVGDAGHAAELHWRLTTCARWLGQHTP
ncbi:MAG TPA: hypothetical protein VKZ60_01775 [Chloroflexota bacterium]|nr:hypothetical protein [Chloroflexota bacterium]